MSFNTNGLQKEIYFEISRRLLSNTFLPLFGADYWPMLSEHKWNEDWTVKEWNSQGKIPISPISVALNKAIQLGL